MWRYFEVDVTIIFCPLICDYLIKYLFIPLTFNTYLYLCIILPRQPLNWTYFLPLQCDPITASFQYEVISLHITFLLLLYQLYINRFCNRTKNKKIIGTYVSSTLCPCVLCSLRWSSTRYDQRHALSIFSLLPTTTHTQHWPLFLCVFMCFSFLLFSRIAFNLLIF